MELLLVGKTAPAHPQIRKTAPGPFGSPHWPPRGTAGSASRCSAIPGRNGAAAWGRPPASPGLPAVPSLQFPGAHGTVSGAPRTPDTYGQWGAAHACQRPRTGAA